MQKRFSKLSNTTQHIKNESLKYLSADTAFPGLENRSLAFSQDPYRDLDDPDKDEMKHVFKLRKIERNKRSTLIKQKCMQKTFNREYVQYKRQKHRENIRLSKQKSFEVDDKATQEKLEVLKVTETVIKLKSGSEIVMEKKGSSDNKPKEFRWNPIGPIY